MLHILGGFMDTLRGIFKFIKKLNKEWGSLFTTFCSFLFTCLYFICTNYLIRRIFDGYLSEYGIYSSITIESPLSNTYMLLFVLITIFVILSVMIPSIIHESMPEPNKRNKINKNIFMYCLILGVLDFLCLLIPSYVFLIYSVKIIIPFFSQALTYILGAMLFSGMVATFTAFYMLIYLSLSKKIYINKNGKTYNTINKYGNALFSILFGISVYIFLYCIDYAALSYGPMTALSIDTYPSFLENEIQYVVIANMPDNKYLAVKLESLLENNETEYIIRNLDNVELKDIHKSEYPEYFK